MNHPLIVDGTKVFLLGNGYAPVFTVRDGAGEVVFSGPVPFLPRDGNNTSSRRGEGAGAKPPQLGFQGLFLPTAVLDPRRGPISVFPDDARCPARCSRLGPATSAWTTGRRSRCTAGHDAA